MLRGFFSSLALTDITADCYMTVAETCPFKKASSHCPRCRIDSVCLSEVTEMFSLRRNDVTFGTKPVFPFTLLFAHQNLVSSRLQVSAVSPVTCDRKQRLCRCKKRFPLCTNETNSRGQIFCSVMDVAHFCDGRCGKWVNLK